MRPRLTVLLALASLATLPAYAKGKKPNLPPYILSAHTISVIIDPDSGIALDDPNANQIARKDVETALLNWGRFQVVPGKQPADLVVVVRRGHKHLVDETLPDPRQNSRPGSITPADNGVQVGGQQGQPPISSSDPSNQRQSPPSTQAEVGPSEDSFIVYDGTVKNPTYAPAAWKYIAPEALHPHNVPAVGEFHKAIDEAEKAAAASKP